MRATASLHNENSAWRPLFGNKSVPYLDPNALFCQYFYLKTGKDITKTLCSGKTREFFLNKDLKFLRTFGALTF